jgi:hypothetical protein
MVEGEYNYQLEQIVKVRSDVDVPTFNDVYTKSGIVKERYCSEVDGSCWYVVYFNDLDVEELLEEEHLTDVN